MKLKADSRETLSARLRCWHS